MITDYHLVKKKYDMETLQLNINNLSKKNILYTQTLTADFCAKYIYDNDIESSDEDSYLFDANYILSCQPHLTKIELYLCIEKRNK